MRNIYLFAALAFPVCAFATPPDAPTVTVSAPRVKQLGFKWNYVPRANYYELWFKANAGATEVKFGDFPSWHPYATNNVSAHLLDWEGARYRVAACNPGGCASTAPIAVKNVLPSTLGFLKSTFTKDHGRFGNVIALSEDGQTLVAAATDERYDPLYQYQLTYLYVYRRVDGKWVPDARIYPEWSFPDDGTGVGLSIDAAGDRFVVGIPQTGGYGGPQGAVIVYHRSASGWIPELQVFGAPETDGIGVAVGIDGAGNTVVAAGSYGDGTTFVYRRSGTTWALTSTFGYVAPGARCNVAAISADASTILRGCDNPGPSGAEIEVFVAPDFTLRNRVAFTFPSTDYTFGALVTDAEARTFVTSIVKQGDTRLSHPTAPVYRWDGYSYTRSITVTPGAWRNDTQAHGTEFGRALAISSDGRFVAVGDGSDDGQGQGVIKGSLPAGGAPLGAVYIVEKPPGGFWRSRNIVKPNYQPGPDDGPIGGFGRALAFGQAGRTLAIGHPGESTHVVNPDDDQEDPVGTESGAVWLY